MNWGQVDRVQKADAILIFGAHVQRNGLPSAILRARTRHGFELWQRGMAPKIVCTGGIGTHSPAEALVEKQRLRDGGVPETAILIETTSTSTHENVRNASALLPRGARVIAVSEAFHLWRCQREGNKFGLQMFTSPETLGWNALERRSRALILLREVAAVTRDLLLN